MTPLVAVGKPGWGGEILDFVMFEHAALGLIQSTTTGEICSVRYFDVIRGRPDFATAGVRYKLLLKSLTKRLPIVRKLPYNVDLMSWVYLNFVLGDPHRLNAK